MKMRAVAERVVTADRNQAIDAEEVEVLQHLVGDVVDVVLILVLQMRRHEFFGQGARSCSRAVQERAAGAACLVHQVFGQKPDGRAVVGVFVRDDVHQATPAPANPDDAMTFPNCAKRYSPDGWVETRYIAAAR